MALPVIALAGIGSLLTEGLKWVIKFYLKTRFARIASMLAMATAIIVAFALFTAGIYAAVAGITQIAPAGFNFALSFLPPSAPIYGGIYLTALISKRTFDWVTKIYTATFNTDVTRMAY